MFIETFRDLSAMRVLDLGGTVEMWTKSTEHPREVVLVNEYAQESPADWIRPVVGDACSLPAELDSERFDLVYSNSVIEHVGGYARRLAFASSVHAMADRHWIQTPYRYFPIEPHWVFPGFQFLPLSMRALISRHWTLTRTHDPSRSNRANLDYVLSIELIGRAEMKHLFPQSELLIEKFAGVPKSLVAIKSG
jgi:hypothetical protein